MAGGVGTRFWPWSVKKKPKQFLSLMSENTMLQETYNRFRYFLPSEKIYIVTTEEYVPIVKEQLPDFNINQIIKEPYQRDTGPCIALTALHFLKENDDEVFAAVPADHFIGGNDSLIEAFTAAEEIAKMEHTIVTFGIRPTRAETGYGYIRCEPNERDSNSILRVKEFIEKPSQKNAEKLLERKNIFWNSGIFVWKPSTIAYYMEKFQPDMWKTLSDSSIGIEQRYESLPKISIDYAILEKADKIYTIQAKFDWDDVGSWKSLERLNEKEGSDNILLGEIKTFLTNNCIIRLENKKAVVVGVEDLIIASTNEGLLVCHKSQEQNIKEYLKILNEDEE